MNCKLCGQDSYYNICGSYYCHKCGDDLKDTSYMQLMLPFSYSFISDTMFAAENFINSLGIKVASE